MSVNKQVSAKFKKLRAAEKQVDVEAILKKPLPEAYKALLEQQKFRYMDMKGKGVEIHDIIKTLFNQNEPSSTKKLLRLA